jgi:hypothetical protein
VQTDASWKINDRHTLRTGFQVQGERTTFNTNSSVLSVDSTGAETSDQPTDIADGGGETGGLYGAYSQDEWRILPAVTVNYGLRLDYVDQFTSEGQASPRINTVWKPTATTTVTAGDSRCFVPPPFELVSPSSIALFANTTAAPAVTQDSTVKAERSDDDEIGIAQVIVPGLTLGVDAYDKRATNLIDEGQFGAPIILSAFNHGRGQRNRVADLCDGRSVDRAEILPRHRRRHRGAAGRHQYRRCRLPDSQRHRRRRGRAAIRDAADDPGRTDATILIAPAPPGKTVPDGVLGRTAKPVSRRPGSWNVR